MKYCLAMGTTKAMKKFGVYPLPIVIPGCEHYVLFSDEYLGCVVKAYPFSIFHYVGTNKMGAYDDSSTVVDPTLKVKGVKGLRVADAFIIPSMPTGHTNFPTMIIGERAAAMILHELHDKGHK
ncbi:uncharacterized protein LOC111613287 [Centruroides sculpturatus]|uniref:uncharacterized protein LOC111613287 n=1 Tax=Centruroides sculpturatus TaxID=218467 RepID=UPI000C6D13F4|nr:uncharacterized protein LOC111613287 [Centruroides sculpturatus]